MKKIKYNLTFWQRLQLPMLRLMWAALEPEKRKTWHEVKKGMEKHKHNYVIPGIEMGIRVLRCDHEGCTMVDPQD